jgi:hypothetical protein
MTFVKRTVYSILSVRSREIAVLAVVSFVSIASSKRFVSASRQCPLVCCDKPACTSLVELCGASACNEVHCKQCHDFECCVTCEKLFVFSMIV